MPRQKCSLGTCGHQRGSGWPRTLSQMAFNTELMLKCEVCQHRWPAASWAHNSNSFQFIDQISVFLKASLETEQFQH